MASLNILLIQITCLKQQIYRVKYLPEPPPGDLDLNCSDEEFSPDKLRSNLERFYMTVVCLPMPSKI